MRPSPGVLVVAALLLLPGAHASWRAAGGFEPDTPFDVQRGRMFLAPDASPDALRRVYFQAYPAFYVTSANPNAGLLGTRLHVVPFVHHQALLGVWKDCNRDGYVGAAEGALREYRADLLPPGSPCPERPGERGVHNDGAWVAEMLMIGGPDPCEFSTDAAYREAECADPREGPGVDAAFVANPHVLYANGTLVWGDLGAPGHVPDDGDLGCPLTPPPRGTTSGTGHLLGYADCQARVATGRSVLEAFNAAAGAADPDDALGLRFDDPRAPQREEGPLNQHFPVNLYGNPTTGKSGLLERDAAEGPAFQAWDCASSRPSPDVLDPDASWWDGAARAFDALAGDCDADTASALDDAHTPLEQRVAAHGAAKSTAYIHFVFNDGSRGTRVPLADAALGASTPQDLGLGALRRTNDPTRRDNNGGPQWDAHTNVIAGPPLLTRDGEPAARQHMTFYARLPTSAIQSLGLLLPSGTTGTYGAEPSNCGDAIGAGMPDRGGYACDPAKWYRTAEGEDAMPSTSEGPERGHRLAPRVGEPYHLLDVDCLDGRVAEGAHASLAAASPEPACG